MILLFSYLSLSIRLNF